MKDKINKFIRDFNIKLFLVYKVLYIKVNKSQKYQKIFFINIYNFLRAKYLKKNYFKKESQLDQKKSKLFFKIR